MLTSEILNSYKMLYGTALFEEILLQEPSLLEGSEPMATPEEIQRISRQLMADPEVVRNIQRVADETDMMNGMETLFSKIDAILFPFTNITLFSKKNILLTKAFSKILPETDLYVRGYPSMAPGAFTFPFVNMTRSKAVEIASYTPILKFYTSSLMFLSSVFNSVIHPRISSPTVSNGKLIVPGLNKATFYISSKMLDILEPPEILSVGLHELGHNTLRVPNLLTLILPIGVSVVSAKRVSAWNTIILGSTEVAKAAVSLLPFLATIGTMLTVLLIYVTRKTEWKSDEFAKKCGFGTELASALSKVDEYFRHGVFKDTSGIVDSLIAVWMNLCWRVFQFLGKLKLVGHPDVKSRVRKLEREGQELLDESFYFVDKTVRLLMKFIMKVDALI